MGYDVTLHPINRKEFEYYIEEVFDKPYLMDTKTATIHDTEAERGHLIKSIYSNFPKFKEQLIHKDDSFEKTIGFAATAILGYLHPFWYLRDGLLSNLLNNPTFKELTANLSDLVKEENKVFFDSENGVEENYSSGVFIPYQNIKKLLDKLAQSEFKHKIGTTIGEENLAPLICCLNYCHANKLDLLESTDLCVPLSGESYTFPSNMRAIHLDNISDYSNQSRKKAPLDFGKKIKATPIEKNWWNNLNDSWRDNLRISYETVVRPRFKRNHTERNLHIETKFNQETLDLAGIDELEEIGIAIIDRNNNYSTLIPFFDFPHLKSMDIGSFLPTTFDLSRVLQFPQIAKLGINPHALQKGLTVTNFGALKALNNLQHLKLGETGLNATALKELQHFTQLVSLSLFFAPYRSVSFLKGNQYLEALALSYTKGLDNLPNLKRLHLFPKEKNPIIKNCPNIELINCYNSKRITDLSAFVHLTKLETLVLRRSAKPIDLRLLSKMSSVKSFFVDEKTDLDSLDEPIEFIEHILVWKDLKEHILELAKQKFPNGQITNYKAIPYE